jgi:hypothetical protein
MPSYVARVALLEDPAGEGGKLIASELPLGPSAPKAFFRRFFER